MMNNREMNSRGHNLKAYAFHVLDEEKEDEGKRRRRPSISNRQNSRMGETPRKMLMSQAVSSFLFFKLPLIKFGLQFKLPFIIIINPWREKRRRKTYSSTVDPRMVGLTHSQRTLFFFFSYRWNDGQGWWMFHVWIDGQKYTHTERERVWLFTRDEDQERHAIASSVCVCVTSCNGRDEERLPPLA